MADMISIDDAAIHLRVDGYEDEDWADTDQGKDVQSKLDQAEAIILNYLKKDDNPDGWTAETVPGSVRAAILLTLSDLFEHRAGSADDDVFLSFAVRSLVHRYCDPAMA
ncbi:head-tail connector protein [Pelagibacterium sp.]|uniref:head-tail connector protein n=1 Tax=Pelagibacterium sp. TaxID=1967288 RepID=UPI003A8F68AF